MIAFTRSLKRTIIAAILMVPAVSHAALEWSGCVKIVAVNNGLSGTSGGFILVPSPAISGCNAGGVTGAISFSLGQEGISSSNINYFFASSLTAYTTGQNVMIYYDNSTSTCYSEGIALSGFAAQC